MAIDVNPYAAPQAALDGAPGEGDFQEVRLFSVAGRMGRIRYLNSFSGAYLSGMLLMAVLGGVLAAIGSARIEFFYVPMGLVYLGILVLWFMFAIQRLHDIDQPGWLSLFYLVPFLNVLFLFYLLLMPGDKVKNRFGRPAPPNGVFSVIVACTVAALLLLGLVLVFAVLPRYATWR